MRSYRKHRPGSNDPPAFLMRVCTYLYVCLHKAAGSYCGTAGKLYPRPYDLDRARTQHARRKGGQQREAAASLVLNRTHSPPAGKRSTTPSHRTTGRDRAERDANAGQGRPEEQPNIRLSLVAHPRRGGAEGKQQTLGRTRSTRRTKKNPRAEQEAHARRNTGRPRRPRHPGRARARK